MPIIRRYECGCIGFCSAGGMSTNLEDHEITCIRACDDHERPYVFERRDNLRNKRSEKLDDHEVAELFAEIAELVIDGYALRELRVAMRVAGLPDDDGIAEWRAHVAKQRAQRASAKGQGS